MFPAISFELYFPIGILLEWRDIRGISTKNRLAIRCTRVSQTDKRAAYLGNFNAKRLTVDWREGVTVGGRRDFTQPRQPVECRCQFCIRQRQAFLRCSDVA